MTLAIESSAIAIVAFLIGIAIADVAARFAFNREAARYDALLLQHEQLTASRTALATENATLKTALAVARSEAANQSQAIEARIRAAFNETASQVLERSNNSFLQLASERMKQERATTVDLLEPFRVGINQLGEMILQLEKDRNASVAATSEQIAALAAADREI